MEFDRDQHNFQLVVRVLMDHSCFMLPVDNKISYMMLREEICRRHKINVKQEFTLIYNTPGSIECFLQNESDFRMMLHASKIYELKKLDINIRLKKDSPSSKVPVNVFDLNLPCPEEDFLGLPFRDVPKKAFLSDEWALYITGVGQKFVGGVSEFRDRMKKYAIQTGFFYFYYRNDATYIALECEEVECTFFIKGCVKSSNNCFYIQECDLAHSCSSVLRKTTHQRLDSDIVAQCFVNEVMYNPNIRPCDMVVKFKLDYGFDIGYKVAQNAKSKALEKIFGKNSESFNKLVWYLEAVKESNPGSVVDLEIDPLTHRFQRVFVSYGGSIEGFKNCVPVLYVDGCFGKSMYKGQILAATSKDGNKGIFPLAICFCDSECEDNWSYFFRNLKKIVDEQTNVITFLSDRGVGLLSACDKIFPSNPHMYCYHHLQTNLSRRYTGRGRSAKIKTVLSLFFQCVFSSTAKEYYHNLKDLRSVGGEAIIDDFLRDLPLERWCRAFAVDCRFGIMANSIAESFNSWICVQRSMAVYSMLEEVRLKQMKMMNERRSDSLTWTTRLTPKMEKVLVDEFDKSRRFRVVKSGGGLFEVRDVFSYEVDLNASTCSCVKWQINSFPCPHVIAAIMSSRFDVFNFINPIFFVDAYRKCYGPAIKPISNVDEAFCENECVYVEAPSVRSQPGRRRKRRFRSAFELAGKKQIKCGRCGKNGFHNKSSCAEAIILDEGVL